VGTGPACSEGIAAGDEAVIHFEHADVDRGVADEEAPDEPVAALAQLVFERGTLASGTEKVGIVTAGYIDVVDSEEVAEHAASLEDVGFRGSRACADPGQFAESIQHGCPPGCMDSMAPFTNRVGRYLEY
jgi:hypothetical protein